MARTPSTTTTRGAAASATDSKVTTKAGKEVARFDAKASKSATIAERKARAAGEKVTETAHTVMPGKQVRAGGVNYTEGDTVHLSAADSERLQQLGVVAQGDAGAKLVADSADTEAAAQAEADAVANAQREADEKAAADKEAADLAAGKLSGTENR